MQKRDMEFLFEVGALRHMERGWKHQIGGMECANDTEHTFRVMFIALLLARMEGGVDEERIMKMALVHDIDESRTGDFDYTQKMYVTVDEDRILDDMFKETSFGDLRRDILDEYRARQTLEAKIVKDADNLDIDIEIKELEKRGLDMPQRWNNFRRMVRDEKLYTESAKKVWDELQSADPADWHVNANKWLSVPEAGK